MDIFFRIRSHLPRSLEDLECFFRYTQRSVYFIPSIMACVLKKRFNLLQSISRAAVCLAVPGAKVWSKGLLALSSAYRRSLLGTVP